MTLSNGLRIPKIGLGTFGDDEGNIIQVVKSAILEHGYRHIDTAKVYQNEDKIGQALQEVLAAGIKREDLYIVTKLWHDDDKLNVEQALRNQLKNLQLDYIDLYVIHWMLPTLDWENKAAPFKNTPTHVVYKELERLVDLGLIKSIGVSNCPIPMLIDILSYARHKPVTNQIELHPYFVQREQVDFQRKLGVEVVAYAPLGAFSWPYKREEHKSLNILKDQLILDLAAKYNKPVGQIILNWHLHRGHIIIPKTCKVERLRENILVYDFQLTEEEYD